MHKEKNFNKKIAIIGCGPAGLGAALALKEKGYTNITLFERNNRVGGQAFSNKYVTPDNRTIIYELGSLQPLSSPNMLRYLKKYGLELGREPLENKIRVLIAISYMHNKEMANFVKYRFGVPAKNVPYLVADLIKLGKYLRRYRRLSKPGFYNFKYMEETSVLFGDWVKEKKFKLIGEKLTDIFNNLMTLGNKTNEAQVTTYSAFKLLYEMVKTPHRYVDGSYRPVKQGYQELWIRVAKDFNIVYEADIKSIVRHDKGITINAKNGTNDFDNLIISCPLQRLGNAIDIRQEENDIFKHLLFNPGYRAALVAKNGPIDGAYWYPDAYNTGTKPPYITFAIPEGKVAENTYLYSCGFSHCDDPANAIKIMQAATEQFFKEHHNAEIVEWVKWQYWADYGARFDVNAVKTGLYDRAHALQGKFKTYYTGEMLGQGANSIAMDFSFDVVENFF